jgi:signal transduction histidine kinase
MTLFLEDFDVAKLVHEVAATVQPLIEKNANTLEVDCAADIGTMRADVTKLRQTLFNLLSNASKLPRRARSAWSRATFNQSAAHSATLTAHFRVTDTGIGMTPEQMGRIFEAFSQADAHDTRSTAAPDSASRSAESFAR